MIAFLFYTYLTTLFISGATGMVAVYVNKKTPLYLKLLPWFILSILVVEKYAYEYSRTHATNNNIFNVVQLVYFLFYSYFFYSLLATAARKWIIYAAVFYLAVAIPLIFFIQGIYYYNSTVYFIGGVLLTIFSSFYLYTLFKSPGKINPFHTPSFWIACGILLYFCCTIPLVTPWILLLHCTPFELKVLHIMLTFVYCTTYLLFGTGFIFHYKNRKLYY
jgi:hypothetical protein